MCVPASKHINNRHVMLMNGTSADDDVKRRSMKQKQHYNIQTDRVVYIENVAKSMKNVFATFITYLITE